MDGSAQDALARRVQSARHRHGWSKENLAAEAGLSFAAVAQIESGRRRDVRLSTIVAIADAFGVSVDHLVGRFTPRQHLEHVGLIYHHEAEFLAAATPFASDGLDRGETVIAVLSDPSLRSLRKALGSAAGPVDFIDAADWYTSPIPALERLKARIQETLGMGSAWLRVLGEPVWGGRTTREVAQWTRYEALVNLALASTPATIVCPYDARKLTRTVVANARRTHPRLLVGDEAVVSEAFVAAEAFLTGEGHQPVID